MNRILLILFLCLLSATSVPARETVKGVVVDSKGDPIPGVKVEIPGSNESVFTDVDGIFQIILREPTKKLLFFYPGLGTSIKEVVPEMKVVLGNKGWEGQTDCYRGMVDLEGGMGLHGNVTIKSGDNEMRNIHTLLAAGVTTTHGAQITENLFFGLGLGASLVFTQYNRIEGYDSNFNCYASTKFSGVDIPLFLCARWDFGLTKKTAPYIGLRLGYSTYIPKNCYLSSSYSYSQNISSRLEVERNLIGSFFFQPTVGYRMTVYRKLGINLGLSYLSGKLSKYTAESYSNGHSLKSKFIQREAGTILFNIGFDF